MSKPVKPPKPPDWDAFVAYYRKKCRFRPRSWVYEKAPAWLWEHDYQSWKRTGRCTGE